MTSLYRNSCCPRHSLHITLLGLCLLLSFPATAQRGLQVFFDPVPLDEDLSPLPLTASTVMLPPEEEEDGPSDPALVSGDDSEEDGSSASDLELDGLMMSVNTLGPMLTPSESVLLAELEATTQRLIEEGGAYNPALSEHLSSLGDYYLERGLHDEALSNYEQAFHISRVSEGLFNEEQYPILSRLTQAHIALGNFDEAHDQQEYLYYLRYKLSDPSQGSDITSLAALAEWNLGIARTAYARRFNDTVMFQLRRLSDAVNQYKTLSEALTERNPQDPRLPEIEARRTMANYYMSQLILQLSGGSFSPAQSAPAPGVRTYYRDNLYSSGTGASGLNFSPANNLGTMSFYRNTGFVEGRDALEKRLAFAQARNDEVGVLMATIDLADWHLLFQRRNRALELYQEAHQFLQTSSLNDKALFQSEFFKTPLPAAIPGFIHNNSRQPDQHSERDYQGYLDVSFSLNRYGNASKVTLLNSHNQDDNTARLLRSLRATITSNIYRPQFDDNGQALDQETVRVRYYYSIASQP